jgi:hypothetical protein
MFLHGKTTCAPLNFRHCATFDVRSCVAQYIETTKGGLREIRQDKLTSLCRRAEVALLPIERHLARCGVVHLPWWTSELAMFKAGVESAQLLP